MTYELADKAARPRDRLAMWLALIAGGLISFWALDAIWGLAVPFDSRDGFCAADHPGSSRCTERRSTAAAATVATLGTYVMVVCAAVLPGRSRRLLVVLGLVVLALVAEAGRRVALHGGLF